MALFGWETSSLLEYPVFSPFLPVPQLVMEAFFTFFFLNSFFCFAMFTGLLFFSILAGETSHSIFSLSCFSGSRRDEAHFDQP